MIRSYIGSLGAGKTYSMVYDAIEHYRKHPCQIYTNMAALVAPEAVYIDSLEELIGITDGLILFDEALVSMPAQYWQDFGRDLIENLMQLRKHGLDLWYTSQRRTGVNVNLRDVTSEVCKCQRFMNRILRLYIDPEDSRLRKRSVVPLTPEVMRSYDTTEKIKRDGGSDGAAGQRPISTLLARARAETTSVESDRYPRTSIYRRSLIDQILGTSYSLSLTRDARIAIDYLEDIGKVPENENTYTHDHYSLIRKEIRRHRWLAFWGISPYDVAEDCDATNPWLTDFDPESVRYRRREREAERAAQAAVLRADVVARSSRSRTLSSAN